ncbi:hypothetical protein [Erwinia psidii]|uniref:Type III secretion system protein n=1 Tax=Erwinia psidii TaxID=69224 RepID=A0A3N6SC51_9GAMM|nr:hypothetical protein [Erwinia psidii]MCX8958725.1 hypothetical protein [Erwinia psidii]MCX8961145.1 hypothetical protein [Erwinia psidii]MCX8966683.1 hypothetical protein [Erwinia psidii]RQM38940.1 hypothetical protein EB241_07070 [Erwinia psidii]
MNADFEQLLRIMYDPSSYTHPNHLAETLLSRDIWDEILINYWIISHYQLEDLPDRWSARDMMTSLILDNWLLLPQAAHFAGSYLLRNQLMKQSALLATDAKLLAFISLPLVYQVSLTMAAEEITPAKCGADFIKSMVTGLPVALQQRIMLSFPSTEKETKCIASPTPDNINLFKMSLAYAYN